MNPCFGSWIDVQSQLSVATARQSILLVQWTDSLCPVAGYLGTGAQTGLVPSLGEGHEGTQPEAQAKHQLLAAPLPLTD